jgi:NAD(P)-dependent dehydrogenase (short-subunit alcohol dehydrogenase family)
MWENKVVIITGSTQGIGLKTAEILLQKGARVVINSRHMEKVQAAIEQLSQYKQNVVGISGDVSDFEFCVELRDFTLQHFQKIDVLINNAGLASSGLLGSSTPKGLNKVFDVNVMGSIFPALACLEDLKKSQGAVLFISSVAGIVGLPGHAAYSASKRTLVSLAESYKNEWFDFGIFVGVNYPGFTENDSNKIMVLGDGSEQILEKRTDVKTLSLSHTASNIIKQIELRKFRSYSSLSASLVQIIYRMFPKISLVFIQIKRKRIMRDIV